jgi:hypothetical protein
MDGARTDDSGAFTFSINHETEDQVIEIIAGEYPALQYSHRFQRVNAPPPDDSWLEPLRRLNQKRR